MKSTYTFIAHNVGKYIEEHSDNIDRARVEEIKNSWEEDADCAYVGTLHIRGEKEKIFAADYGDFVRIAMEHDKEEDHSVDPDMDPAEKIGNAIITHINMITG